MTLFFCTLDACYLCYFDISPGAVAVAQNHIPDTFRCAFVCLLDDMGVNIRRCTCLLYTSNFPAIALRILFIQPLMKQEDGFQRTNSFFLFSMFYKNKIRTGKFIVSAVLLNSHSRIRRFDRSLTLFFGDNQLIEQATAHLRCCLLYTSRCV